jgi:predicted CXXCH cytochrome family protein
VKKAAIIAVAIALCIGGPAASEPASEGNVPKVIVLRSLSKVYEPVRLNHSDHISAAGGCADCHHQHGSVQVQTCSECHRYDPSTFKKNIDTGNLKPCVECHPAVDRPGKMGLKTAYHQACFKCHKSDVGDGVKNLSGCTEMCHVLKTQEKKQ